MPTLPAEPVPALPRLAYPHLPAKLYHFAPLRTSPRHAVPCVSCRFYHYPVNPLDIGPLQSMPATPNLAMTRRHRHSTPALPRLVVSLHPAPGHVNPQLACRAQHYQAARSFPVLTFLAGAFFADAEILASAASTAFQTPESA